MKHFLSPKRELPSETEKMQPALAESEISEHHDINITEGGEFLDDSIRMKDQPMIEISFDNINLKK